MLSELEISMISTLAEVATFDKENKIMILDEGFVWSDYWMFLADQIGVEYSKDFAKSNFPRFKIALKKIQFFKSTYDELNGLELAEKLHLSEMCEERQIEIIEKYLKINCAYQIDEYLFCPERPRIINKLHSPRKPSSQKEEHIVWIYDLKRSKAGDNYSWMIFSTHSTVTEAQKEMNFLRKEGKKCSLNYYPQEEIQENKPKKEKKPKENNPKKKRETIGDCFSFDM